MKERRTILFLKSLTLQNFATFKNQTISFSEGLNTIIGETGSGKSLILDALQMVFGGKAERKFIRKDEEFASIEAIFLANDESIIKFCDEIGHPVVDDEVIIKRIISNNGKTRSFINYQQCSTNTLLDFSREYVDLVGQFENQKLLSEEYQLKLLDSYANSNDLLNDYLKHYQQLEILKKNVAQLAEKNLEREQRQDYLKFQIDEIVAISPSLEEEEELAKKKNKVFAQQKISEKNKEILEVLSNGEHFNVCSGVKRILNIMEHNDDIYDRELVECILAISNELDDISYSLSAMSTESSEDEIAEVMNRLEDYQKLKRKFGKNVEEILKNLRQYQDELNDLQSIDDNIQGIQAKIYFHETEAKKIAAELHLTRLNAAKELSHELTIRIRNLLMDSATSDIRIQKIEKLNNYGSTSLSLMAETNKGEGFYRVKDIASGGELSRILLALRTILSEKDSISIFLFDEIDTGIGGKTALRIGASLKDVSTNSQVIAITHLPQIANYADKLVVVQKFTDEINGETRTISEVCEIVGDEKQKFIKEMNPIN